MSAYSQDLYLTRYTLLHRIQSQVDEVAWKDFTDQYRLYIYAIINRMNIKATDADDLYQKILLKLWKKMPDLDLGEMERFRSYLATVVRNCVNDYFRSAIRKQKNQDSFVDHEASCGKQYTLPAIEELIETEWHNHVAAKAFENISIYFSDQAIEIFKRSLSEEVKDIASDLAIPLSTAYRLRNRIKESLLKEIAALSEYLG